MPQLNTRSVVVTNGKTERVLSGSAWDLLKSSKEPGNTRKGWSFVRFDEPGKGAARAKAINSSDTYIPPEVASAATATAEQVAAAEASMTAGEKVTSEQVSASTGSKGAEQTSSADPAQEAQVEQPAQEAQQEAAGAAGEQPNDDLSKIKNVGPKTVDVLIAAGIRTYAQLRDANEAELAAALDANGLGVKKALITHWKKDAAALANA